MNTSSPAARCGLAAHATRRLDADAITEAHRQPKSLCGTPLPVNLLRHSDEQTIAALAAVLTASDRFGLADSFAEWGVVTAPRFIGRPAVTQTLGRFLVEGPWGVSPHVIPHRSPHSVPGTLSQALSLHGPNFAVGGGAGGEVEALLTGVTLLEAGIVPGVWVVLSRLSPESACDATTGRPAPDVEAVALALALTASATTRTLELRIAGAQRGGSPSLADLEALLSRFEEGSDVEHSLGDVGRLVLRHRTPAYAGPHANLFAPGQAAREHP